MNITILGTGRLGYPMAALFASRGHKVVGVDSNDDLISRLQMGTYSTDEPEVNTLAKVGAERMVFERLPAEAVAHADLVFVVVATPSKDDGTFDSSQVVTACRQIGAALYEKKTYTVVVVVSTLMPGQMDADVVPALESASEKRAGVDFGVCYNPQFIALGRVIQGLREPDYLLIGHRELQSLGTLKTFWLSITPAATRSMSFVNAELAKLATNAYLSLKIAYANLLGEMCEDYPGANVDVVTQAVGSDQRIGKDYLRAGLPAGGVCLPRDLKAFTEIADAAGVVDSTVAFLRDVNGAGLAAVEWWIATTIDPQFKHEWRDSTGLALGILGTGYSASTLIEEGSFALELRDALIEDEFTVWTEGKALSGQALVDKMDVVILALPLDSYKELKFHEGQTIMDIWRVLAPEQMPTGVTLRQFGVGEQVSVHE